MGMKICLKALTPPSPKDSLWVSKLYVEDIAHVHAWDWY